MLISIGYSDVDALAFMKEKGGIGGFCHCSKSFYHYKWLTYYGKHVTVYKYLIK